MSVILHVGTHKTGTTTLQKFMRANESALLSAGLLYPGYGAAGKKSRYAHHHIAHAIAGDERILSFEDVKSIVKKSSEVAAEKNVDVLFSAEPFYRHFIGSDEVSQLWVSKKRYVERVAEVFGHDAEILFVLRRQDDFAASMYQENVKVNRISQKFEEFVASESHYFDYWRNISMWASVFPKVRVLVFEDLISGDGLERNFMSALGLSSDGFKFPPKVNESLPYELVEFKRVLNATPLSINVLRDISARLLDMENRAGFEFSKKKLFWCSLEARKDILKRFNEGNARIARQYFDSRENLFEGNFQEFSIFNGIDDDLFVRLFARYVLPSYDLKPRSLSF